MKDSSMEHRAVVSFAFSPARHVSESFFDYRSDEGVFGSYWSILISSTLLYCVIDCQGRLILSLCSSPCQDDLDSHCWTPLLHRPKSGTFLLWIGMHDGVDIKIMGYGHHHPQSLSTEDLDPQNRGRSPPSE